jgi:diketogulonate reductase-like aldo/keto reductase
MYGAGHCEELIGQAMQGFDRTQLTIASKVSDLNLKYDEILASAESSLKRLGVDYLDLYYVHAPSPDVSLEETMIAMNRLVDDGLVRNIGVSNFPVEHLRQAQVLSQHKIVANQIEYNLMTREIGTYGSRYEKNEYMESEILPYCQDNDIFVVACRPLGQGQLMKGNVLVEEISKKYNKTPAQIALNWLVSQNNVVAIPMSKNIDHLSENIKACEWRMETEDIEKLRSEFSQNTKPTSFLSKFFR